MYMNKNNKQNSFVHPNNYTVCIILAFCRAPTNGLLYCDGMTTRRANVLDYCTFMCNQGYSLRGHQSGTCFSSNTWSRGLPSCMLLNCPNRIFISNDTIVEPLNCRLTYSSQCRVYCTEGHSGDDVIYLCNATSDPAVADWVPIGGVHSVCERG